MLCARLRRRARRSLAALPSRTADAAERGAGRACCFRPAPGRRASTELLADICAVAGVPPTGCASTRGAGGIRHVIVIGIRHSLARGNCARRTVGNRKLIYNIHSSVPTSNGYLSLCRLYFSLLLSLPAVPAPRLAGRRGTGPDLLNWGLPGGGVKSAKVAPTPYVY